MKTSKLHITVGHNGRAPEKLTEEITDIDRQIYKNVVSTDLSPEQIERIVNPTEVFYQQDSILAVHWHPEFIPMDLIFKRIRATFPNSKEELIIPTQHNDLLSVNGFSGVEIDCYAKGFNRKVQLLVHFEESKVKEATVFKNMLAHTFKYRHGQLYEFIDTILDPKYEDRLQKAAAKTGADDDIVNFVRINVAKVKSLIEENFSITPREMLRNKILKYFIDGLRDHCDDRFIERAQIFLKAVKKIVKANFSLEHFYETQEFIEEIRALGGGIVVPHPEQFWPVLLADYDVDGYEVWNPQSREFTEFLITVVHRQNQRRKNSERQLLVFMGDDCHMGEKTKEPRFQDFEKANRQIGYQPAWDDPAIRKNLIVANINRKRVITEYKNRLN